MKKVKVHRYVSGKRPDYAPAASSEEESEEEDFLERRVHKSYEENEISIDTPTHSQVKICDEDDPRIRRLTRLEKQKESNTEIRAERHRHIHEPELIEVEPERTRERI